MNIKNIIALIQKSPTHVLSNDLFASNLEDIREWLSIIKKEPVTTANARLFNELLATINRALEVVDHNIIVYLKTITKYYNSRMISSYNELSSDSAIISSLIHNALIQFITHHFEFKTSNRSTIYTEFIKILMSMLIDYLQDV